MRERLECSSPLFWLTVLCNCMQDVGRKNTKDGMATHTLSHHKVPFHISTLLSSTLTLSSRTMHAQKRKFIPCWREQGLHVCLSLSAPPIKPLTREWKAEHSHPL